jgi:RNA recognition motif-containing protein
MNIYVGNIPHSSSEDSLKRTFEAYGQVSSAKLIKDKFTGNSRGFGFIEMPNDKEAQAAMDALNGQDFEGRPLRLSEARPREERPTRSFGGNNRY